MNAVSMPLNRAPSRSALAWKMVLLGSPLLVATVFFFVWRAQVSHFANRAVESYGGYVQAYDRERPLDRGRLSYYLAWAATLFAPRPESAPVRFGRMPATVAAAILIAAAGTVLVSVYPQVVLAVAPGG